MGSPMCTGNVGGLPSAGGGCAPDPEGTIKKFCNWRTKTLAPSMGEVGRSVGEPVTMKGGKRLGLFLNKFTQVSAGTFISASTELTPSELGPAGLCVIAVINDRKPPVTAHRTRSRYALLKVVTVP